MDKDRIAILGGGFNVADALTFARLSAAAYQAGPGPDFIYDPWTRTQVVITETATDFIIAFPGTHDLRDVLTDLQCVRLHRLMGKTPVQVHGGFIRAFESVEAELVDRVRQASPIKRIWLCGHSLGGALATICAAKLRMRDYPVAGVYTFGEPRNGNLHWADMCDALFGSVHFRLEDELDPVTRLPSFIFGNRHSGHLYFMDGRTIWVDPVLVKKAFYDFCKVTAVKWGWLEVVEFMADHFIKNYVARLESLQPPHPQPLSPSLKSSDAERVASEVAS